MRRTVSTWRTNFAVDHAPQGFHDKKIDSLTTGTANFAKLGAKRSPSSSRKNDMSATKVVVTGATGHVGNVLVRALLHEGYSVKGASLGNASSIEGLDVEHIEADVRDRAQMDRLICGADVVFHLAAIVGTRHPKPHLLWETNTTGAANVFAACLDAGVKRLVHFSSIHAFESSWTDAPITEETPLTHSSKAPLYSHSKAEGTRLARQYHARGLDVVVIHPTGIVGPNDFPVSELTQAIIDIHARPPAMSMGGGFNFVDVRDVVKTALAALRIGRSGESYLVGGRWASTTEVVSLTRPPGSSSRVRTIPLSVARRALPVVRLLSTLTKKPALYTESALEALSTNRFVDDVKARRELGHASRPLEETCRDLSAWITERGLWRNTSR